jgi:hypothetical protein
LNGGFSVGTIDPDQNGFEEFEFPSQSGGENAEAVEPLSQSDLERNVVGATRTRNSGRLPTGSISRHGGGIRRRHQEMLPLVFFPDHIPVSLLHQALPDFRRDLRHRIHVVFNGPVLVEERVKLVLPAIHENADFREIALGRNFHEGSIHSKGRLPKFPAAVHTGIGKVIHNFWQVPLNQVDPNAAQRPYLTGNVPSFRSTEATIRLWAGSVIF